MPFPVTANRIESNATRSLEVKVFVCYSHDDTVLAREFRLKLKELWLNLSGDYYQDVYFDEDRRIPGFEWQPGMYAHIDAADLVIFLMSTNALVKSEYCLQKELRRAAKNNKTIVPVWLTHCTWEGIKIPDHPTDKRLGDLNALPLDIHHQKLQPVTQWSDIQSAWTEVQDGLKRAVNEIRAIKNVAAVPEQYATRTVQAHGNAAAEKLQALAERNVASDMAYDSIAMPLLPYLCNQTLPEGKFKECLLSWESQALLVLVKGIYDDNPGRFWNRLHATHLSQYFGARRNLSCATATNPFSLHLDGNSDLLTAELSRALTRNPYEFKGMGDMARWLAARPEATVLVGLPQRASSRELKRGIECLLTLLQKIEDDRALSKVVIVIAIEDAALATSNLTKLVRPASFNKTRLIELPALCEVSANDIRDWYELHQLQRLGIEESTVLGVLAGNSMLRLREFDKRIQPLLRKT
jgi:TIR domain